MNNSREYLLLFLLLILPTVSSCLFFQSNREVSENSPTQLDQVALVSQTSGLTNKADEKALLDISEEGGLNHRFQKWNVKLFIVRVGNQSSLIVDQIYSYNATYHDLNGNQFQDKGDAGFFNPASTVKVGIAALTLEKLKSLELPKETTYQFNNRGNWFNFATDIQRAVVISDNEATNRLIQFLGFTPLNRQIRAKGIHYFAVNRLMLDRGTLIKSPNIRLKHLSTNKEQGPISVQGSYPCWEKHKTLGNCATAQDLSGIWLRITHPEKFSKEQSFDLRPKDRSWLMNILSQTPRQAGFKKYADNYCRFLTGIESSLVKPQGQMLSKCGVALFSRTYVDTSYIQTKWGEQFISVFAVSPPKETPEDEIFAWMSQVIEYTLPRLPK